MSKFRLEEVSDLVAWNQFVDDSPQGTIFSNADYLRLAVDCWKVYWIKKGNQIKAGLALVLNEDGNKVILDDLVIHNGLMFALDKEQKGTKARLERFEITEFVIDWLTVEYQHIELALSPQFEDMRPFLWHNYHSSEPTNKFRFDHRYTSYLSISSLHDRREEQESALFKELETLRQRNIREARKDGASCEQLTDGVSFVDDYYALMIKQGSMVDDDKLVRIRRLINGLIDADTAALWVFRNGRGEVIYTTVFCWDSKRAYYLFGAPAPNAGERYQGTIAFWDSFCRLAELGINEVDLEGVNSPKRGWFKLGFGGDLRSYIEVCKEWSGHDC